VARDKPLDFSERCRMDIQYIQHKSLKLDIWLVIQTALLCVTKRSGV
jgi:lipopolysaccharide/colanic/teichoic acid biosynthesis glycosyltransferase